MSGSSTFFFILSPVLFVPKKFVARPVLPKKSKTKFWPVLKMTKKVSPVLFWPVHFCKKCFLARPKNHQRSVARPILARPLLQKIFSGPSLFFCKNIILPWSSSSSSSSSSSLFSFFVSCIFASFNTIRWSFADCDMVPATINADRGYSPATLFRSSFTTSNDRHGAPVWNSW